MTDKTTAECEAFACCNTWFASLPDGRQAVLREDKWMLAHAAFQAGRASLPLPGAQEAVAPLPTAAQEPVKRVFIVATGEEHEGEATYTRYDDAPPPLCDSECLYAAPQPALSAGWVMVPVEPTEPMLDAVDEEVGGHCYSCSKWIASADDCRRVWSAMIAAAPPSPSMDGESNG